jgi:N6-L-threonylcarbamoyladenine synthase
MGDFLTLGIETSCDETSAAVLATDPVPATGVGPGSGPGLGRVVILSNVIASQVDLHGRFGGVVPEIASRRHLDLLVPVVQEALDGAGVEPARIDLIAVTAGPGLVGALLVGVSAAKAMGYALGRPFIGVQHLEGHLCANFLDFPDLRYPFVCLIVSGGHSDLLLVKGDGDLEVLGRTRDDAAGEAFDKVARVLGLGYPGGPQVDRLAGEGDPALHRFPRAYLEAGSWDFSFSGIKTAVANFVTRETVAGRSFRLADVAAGFQEAVAEVLVEKTIRAATKLGVERVAIAGGVAANSALRRRMKERGEGAGMAVFFPRLSLCTDNAAMIACAGLLRYRREGSSPLDLNAAADLPFGPD